MFRDTLLESAPTGRKRKRWPMALAVTLELLVGAVLIALPLLSTGIIPVSARVPLIAPRLTPVPVKAVDDHPHGDPVPDGGGRSPAIPVIPIASGPSHIGPVDPIRTGDDRSGPPDPNALSSSGPSTKCELCITPEVPKPPTRVRISAMQPGTLMHRVEPEYPKMAQITGIHGEVKLHAIIAKDGTIQSLSVISGHPILARAAMDAVRQWRYQPYILNGEAVEVETFVTVNFNRAN